MLPVFKSDFATCKTCLVTNDGTAAKAGCGPMYLDGCIAKNAVKLFKHPGNLKSNCLETCIHTSAFKSAFDAHRAKFCKTCVNGMKQSDLESLIKSKCPGKDGKLTIDDSKNCLDAVQKSLEKKSTNCAVVCEGGKPKPDATPAAEVYRSSGEDGAGGQAVPHSGGNKSDNSSSSGAGGSGDGRNAQSKSINDVPLLTGIHGVYKRARRDEWKNFI